MTVIERNESRAQELIGRDGERDLLIDLLAGVAAGSGSALVFVGGPGVGKTALLAVAAERAHNAGVRVLRVAGAPSEAALPFAALHQALAPLCAGLPRLPSSQQHLLRRVFGDGPEIVAPGDRFRVALAALDLLSDAAADTPVLLIVDDAHWVDVPSLEVLAFVGRRLTAEPMGLLAAVRDERLTTLAGLPRAVVNPLDMDAAKHLLASAFPTLPARRSQRVLDMARGNPLALLELPSTTSADAAPNPAVTEPISSVIRESFSTRLAPLPPATATLLLLAAIESSLSVAELLTTAASMGSSSVALTDLQPAIDARVIEIGDQHVTFVHPLVAAAIYHSASAADRHHAHAAVAAALGPQSDRGIWHRTSAAIGRDNALANDLADLASRASSHGAPSVAVTALARSSALTDDSRIAGQRLLRAAETACSIGQAGRALALLAEADTSQWGLDETVRAAVVTELAEHTPLATLARLSEIIDLSDRLHGAHNDDAAIGLLWNAAAKCWRASSSVADRDRLLAATDRLDGAAHHPLRLTITACLGRPTPVGNLGATVHEDAVVDMAHLAWLGCTLVFYGDYPAALTALSKAIVAARAQAQFALISQIGVVAAQMAVWSGQLDLALTTAQEGQRSADELGLTHWAITSAVTAALVTGIRGDYHAAAGVVERTERELAPTGDRYAFADWQHGLAVAALLSGEHARARHHLERILDEGDLACHYGIRLRIVGDLAEAITATEGRAAARAAIAELLDETRLADTPVSRIAAAHAAAVTAGATKAEDTFRAALTPELVNWPLLRGRLELAYGLHLRGRHHLVEARTHLRTARDVFSHIGIAPLAARAREELAATGEYTDRDRPRPASALTPQEWQIATMAADGLTNRQIGQQLFLSHRTVGSHLYHLFPKLGVTSRNQLAGALADAE